MSDPTTPTTRPPATRTAPPPRMPTPPPQTTAPRTTVQFGKPHAMAGHRVALYASGGWGKSTLATFAPSPVVFVDLDDSLPILWPQIEANGLADKVNTLRGIETWPQLIAALGGDGWDGVKTVVIDTLTKAEELCAAEVLRTVPHEKGGKVERIEDYGFGKGFSHIFDTFMPLLATLDRHVKAGRNVVLVCHECANTFPNPMGQDYLRYEPRLQSPASGKSSIRLRVKEWCDHLLFGAYDVATVEAKQLGGKTKALGNGSRRIYPQEMPYCMAKSRTLSDQIEYDGNAAEIWNMILGVK